MVDIGTAKLIQYNTDEKSLEYFRGLKVQLVFRPRGFYDINHEKIVSMINKFDIRPISIHYPSFRGMDDKFIDNLKMLRDTYEKTLFTWHPKFDSLEKTIEALAQNFNRISGLGVVLALENMPGPKDRWYCFPQNLSLDFPFTRITYDITHLYSSMDEIDEISSILDRVSVVHLSNVKYNGRTSYHLPFSEGDRDLKRFLRHIKTRGYDGQIILEYLPRTSYKLRDDIKKVERIISG